MYVGLRVPPPVEEVESFPRQTSIYFIWRLPKTSSTEAIDTIRFGIGPYGTHPDYLPMVNLDKDTQTYTAERLTPGARYTVAILTQNSEGDSEAVIVAVETLSAIQGTDIFKHAPTHGGYL